MMKVPRKMATGQALSACCSLNAGGSTALGSLNTSSPCLSTPAVAGSCFAPVFKSAWSLSGRSCVRNAVQQIDLKVAFRKTNGKRFHLRASKNDAGKFEWDEGSIVIPKFDENFFPVGEDGKAIEVPVKAARKPRARKPELDADGNPVVPKTRSPRKKAAAEDECESEDEGPKEKKPRELVSAKKLADEAAAKAKRAKAKKRKKAVEVSEETAEEPVAEDEPPAEPDYDELIAELEARESLDEADKRKLLAYKRTKKGKLLSELRESALKQVNKERVKAKGAELLKLAEKTEVKWHTIHCTTPEKRIADAFRASLQKFAPDEEVDIRLPEIPEVKFTKSGEPRLFTTSVTNNVLFIKARMSPEVQHAMKMTTGIYNVEGTERSGKEIGIAPKYQAERFVAMLEEAEKKVADQIAAAEEKLRKEKEEAAKQKAEALAAKKAGKDQQALAEIESVGIETAAVADNESDPPSSDGVPRVGKYAPGTSVEIARGAFAGLNGTVSSSDPEKKELAVMITILGQPTEINLAFKDVRPMKARAKAATPASDPFAKRFKDENASEQERPSSKLDWDWDSLPELPSRGDELDSLFDEPTASGRDGGVDLGEEGGGVPLRVGSEVVVKKGPFKGCTGHVTELLLDKGLIVAQIEDEGELRLLPLEIEPEEGGKWSLPPGFVAKTAPLSLTLPKPKKQLLWLDEDDAQEETEPVRKLGRDGRPKDPDWARFERKPRGGVEHDLDLEGADPSQREIGWQRVSFKLPTGKSKRLMVKYLGTNADNSAEMLLTEDLDVVTGVWRRLKVPGSKAAEAKARGKKKGEELPAFMTS